jgi:hypothetical protein
MKCPDYSHTDPTHTHCIPFDIIYDELHNKLHLYQLIYPNIFCRNQENAHICDTERVVGPIKLDDTSDDKGQPMFFFTNKEGLQTERFEFHKSKKSSVADISYIYMLYQQQNVDIKVLDEYLDQNQMSSQQVALSEEQLLINSMFEDFSQGGLNTN